MKTLIETDESLKLLKEQSGLTWTALIRLGLRWLDSKRDDNERFRILEEKIEKCDRRINALQRALSEETK